MEEIIIQPRRRTFVKAAIVLFSILSVVGVMFFIYSRQVIDKSRQVADKITVINGITVPPEPDPVISNATLARVDSNNNGVWDDVEENIQVFDGIPIPPEPDPTINNVTLAGVDSNTNGVRDDVELVIAGASKKTTYDTLTLPIAKLYNQLATSRLSTPEEVADVIGQIYCFDIKRTASERQTISAEDIEQLTNNTPERVSIANANDTLLATKSVLVEKGFTCN